MVKRNTDYKQVFLVDEFYLKHFNLQNQNLNNTISNNPKISLTTPQSSQYFNNHYNILNPTTLQSPFNSTFDNQKYYNNSQTKNSNSNKTSDIPNLNNEREYDKSNLNQNNFSKFQNENPNVNGISGKFLDIDNQIVHESTDFRNNTRKYVSEEDEVINPPDPFPYYDNYEQDQETDEFSTNKAKTSVKKTKDFLNKTKKQLYMCYICKQTFNSILLLEKHVMMKHIKYPSPNQNINDRNDNGLIESSDNENQISNQNQSDVIDQEPIENASRNLTIDEVVDKDDDYIDIPDPQSTQTDMENTNNFISIRNDIQPSFPNDRNIVRKKKEYHDIEKFYTYKCGKCSADFRNYDSLKKHQMQLHGDVGSAKRSITSKMQGIIKENQNVEELNSYWCSACGKFFQNFASLKVHLQKDHQNTPIRAKRSKMNDKVKRKKVLYYSRY